MAVGCKIIDLVRPAFSQNTHQRRTVGHVPAVQNEAAVAHLLTLKQVIDLGGIVKRGTPLDPVNGVVFL